MTVATIPHADRVTMCREAAKLLLDPTVDTVIAGRLPNADPHADLNAVAASVRAVCEMRDLLGSPARVLAPAICQTATTPAGHEYRGQAREYTAPWEDWQYGLARRLSDTSIDGYAFEVLGEPLHLLDAGEPRARRRSSLGGHVGTARLLDAIEATGYGDPRCKPVVVTGAATVGLEPKGWREALVEALAAARVESVERR